ncbi:MAG: NAD(P)-dependent glycerol-3-phosphate dehydrogenase [Chloroflexi bacterium]|nr:MAG: NAD(P)-dependent glycerol-3-phosphate dehydrogenase [Chloroflexota bacterium]
MTFRTAAVIGSTAWGTTLALLLARNGLEVTLFTRTPQEAAEIETTRQNTRRLPGIELPELLHATSDAAALEATGLVVIGTPAQTVAANLEPLVAHIASDATVLSASKGIEISTGRRMSEVIYDALPGRPVAALSGPNLSREVSAGLPGTTVIASADASLDDLSAAFHGPTFRVYTTEDIVGVELGGALKNIFAIVGGMVDAFGYGDNAKGAILTRGLAEMTRLGVAAGADPLTFQGLAGVGDLMASAYSKLSRNHRLGELLGRGTSLADAVAEIGEAVEGAATTTAALGLAARYGVEMPITQGLHAIMHEGQSPEDAVRALLQREPRPERLS